MNSVHELIAFFVQRGSCIESIYLRKEKQRHFCQDTYFRSPPKQAAADMESEEAAHEAWVASLIPPPEAPVTAHEAERAAMINRRRHFMATLMHQPLTEETFAAATAANIFTG